MDDGRPHFVSTSSLRSDCVPLAGRRRRRDAPVVVRRRILATMAATVVLASCSSSTPGDDNAYTVAVTLSDSGCDPRSISAKAGPTTFRVTNEGSAAVTEFEVLQGGRILGEVENVIPGRDRTFSLTLTAGSYT